MNPKHDHDLAVGDAFRLIARLLKPDASFVWMAIIYGAAVALLALATPISVQLLINSVANTALEAPLFVLSGLLLLLLTIAAGLSAARIYVMALFERRAFARLAAEITLRTLGARDPHFSDARRGDLFNRFFDLVTIQKAVPHLVVGGFAIFVQAVIGIVLTSFYHPFFLAFNAVLVVLLVLVGTLWLGPAVRSASALSHAKHESARCLESIGGANGFYRSGRALDFALARSEAALSDYVQAHRRHFRHTFAQAIGFLLIYALASASLLAMGGWLILQNQLSLGQLVAAELVLSSVFYGISQLNTYAESFYELVASLHELALLYDIEQEDGAAGARSAARNGALRLRDIEIGRHRFDFAAASGEHLAVVATAEAEQALARLLQGTLRPQHGLATLGGIDMPFLHAGRPSSDVLVLDRPSIAEMTIREYLSLAEGEQSPPLVACLDVVGLCERIQSLPLQLDTPLAASGWPLSTGELAALQLATALLRPPKLLMLSTLYDLMPPDRLQAALARLREAGTTVLQLTIRPEAYACDGYLLLGSREQVRFANPSGLLERNGGTHALAA